MILDLRVHPACRGVPIAIADGARSKAARGWQKPPLLAPAGAEDDQRNN